MKGESGYWFALPRLCARLAGQKVRRAEWSRWEAYGLGWLVFAIGCVFLGHALSRSLGRGPGGCFACCYAARDLGRLSAALFRELAARRACSAGSGFIPRRTNNPLQSFILIALITLLAALLVRDEIGWLHSLGIFWLALVGLNLSRAELLERIA